MSCNSSTQPVSRSTGITELVSKSYDWITLAEAKTEIGYVDTGDTAIDADTDAQITAKIQQAQDDVEKTTYKTYGTTVRKWRSATWPANGLKLGPSLTSVDAVGYVDVDGNAQTVDPSNYYVIIPEYGDGVLMWNPGYELPALHADTPLPVTIDYTSGGTVPPAAGAAMRLMLQRLWDNQLDSRQLGTYEQSSWWSSMGDRDNGYA